MATFQINEWRKSNKMAYNGQTLFRAKVSEEVGDLKYKVHPSHPSPTSLRSKYFTLPEISRAPKKILEQLKEALTEAEVAKFKTLTEAVFEQGDLNKAGYRKLANVFGCKKIKTEKKQPKADTSWAKWQQTDEERARQRQAQAKREEARRRANQREAEERARQQRQRRQSTRTRSTANPYSVLGVDRNASEQDVKSAYRRLVMKYHPDTSSLPEEQAKEFFNRLVEAYTYIKNTRF